MPELPEVESVRRGLVRARLRGPVTRVWRSRQQLRIGAQWKRANERLNCLLHATPGPIRRRGKYLIWHMDGADGTPLALLIHLGMSGRCGVARPEQRRVDHTHLILDFEDGRQLRFVDPRRFGGLRAGPRREIYDSDPISGLGPEPLSRGFGGPMLEAALGRSVRPLRDALLDQHAVAGIGNIYAVEACFEAGLDPRRPAARLSSRSWGRLADAVQLVLRRGIDNGGTTLKDFRNVVGDVGRNQDDLRVYGRGGQPCPTCGRKLRDFISGGRSGVLCTRCQS
ncbi:MAG: bifunctional DNA-formamidopyrimidine glycosylase/DNA-(apurinic or apyrimidinic site) lyase [Myxococcales bacterium]|nr:bifunctional DNA-formamidopyrimidine glycosylase/DNA-(apurinic or apyrimidinic site) lyase [Myxococcales bacterium]